VVLSQYLILQFQSHRMTQCFSIVCKHYMLPYHQKCGPVWQKGRIACSIQEHCNFFHHKHKLHKHYQIIVTMVTIVIVYSHWFYFNDSLSPPPLTTTSCSYDTEGILVKKSKSLVLGYLRVDWRLKTVAKHVKILFISMYHWWTTTLWKIKILLLCLHLTITSLCQTKSQNAAHKHYTMM